jgi:hypothetical protein
MQYELPSAPPKDTDNRSFDDTETWQAEALDPATLANIVRAAIEERFDRQAHDQVLADEEEARRYLISRLGGEREWRALR